MKKIGYVLADFPALSETFISTELHAVMARGHEVVPVIMRRGDVLPTQTSYALLVESAVYLDQVPHSVALGVLGRPGRRSLQGLRFALRQRAHSTKSLVWNAAKIAGVARGHGCDHLHAHFAWGAAAHAIVAARLIGATVSFVAHGADVYLSPEDLSLKLESADFAVAVCRDALEDMGKLCPHSRLRLVPCGVDPDCFRPSESGEESNGRLLYVGRLVEKKGVDGLLRALAAIPAAERPPVDAVGTGPQRNALESLAKHLGLDESVRFLGAQPAEWISYHGPHYQGLVAPFRVAANGDRDTGPLVVKEAIAMCLPVIATRLMGLRDIVTEDTGFLVPADDPAAMAHAVTAVARLTAPERTAMGARGRARILAHFSADEQGRLLSSLFESPAECT
jgi:glycosyltransferase involved in cell wall biosynthesis